MTAALLRDTLSAYQHDKASRMAAGITYYALLSLAPILFIATIIVRMVLGLQEAQQWVIAQLQGLIPANALTPIASSLGSLQPSSTHWLGIFAGFVLLFITGSTFMFALQDALHTVWHITVDPGGLKKMLRKRLIGFLFVCFFGVLMLALSLSSLAIALLDTYIQQYLPLLGVLIPWLYSGASLLILTLLFALLLQYLPDVIIPWNDVWIGSFATAVLFTIGQMLLGIYFHYAGLASAPGAAGSVIALLVWMYYSSQVFLLGAEFTKIYSQMHGPQAVPTDGASFQRSVSISIDQLSPLQKLRVAARTVRTEIKIVRWLLWLKRLPHTVYKRLRRK